VRESAVIRLVGGELYWYPPGSSGSPRPLADASEKAQLQAIASARRAPLVFAVPGADVSLRCVEFLAAERRHIARSLPYLLEDEFASVIEELHFASRSLGRLELGVAACTTDKMEYWQEQLTDLPLVNQWVPEPLLLPWRTDELCVLVEADLVLVRYGMNNGFAVERELAGELLAALAATESFAVVVVYGTDQQVDMRLLPESLRENLQWRTGDFSAALMLAVEEKQVLNLCQGAYGANVPVGRWWQQWRVAAALFVAAFGLQVVATYADYRNLESENLQMRRQIEATYREVNPKGKARDHVKALQQQLDSLQGGPQGPGFVSLLERIGRVVQTEQGAQLGSINFTDKLGDLRLNLVVPDFKAVESIRTRLDAAGLDAQMENSNTQGDAVRARLKVREK
jgi:type II secretion system protein L